MDFEEKVGVLLITSFLALSLISLSKAQYESPPYPINASISQPISISISDQLKKGIWFTNGTQKITQYPITNVTIENNATHNYAGPSEGTLYNISAGDNTINVSIYMMLCDNLMNSTFNAWINLTYDEGDGGQGMFFGNGTTATAPTLTTTAAWSFSAIDTYTLIAPNVDRLTTRHFRFWLDPWPNNAPSVIYNTTFKIRAVDYTQPPGTGSC